MLRSAQVTTSQELPGLAWIIDYGWELLFIWPVSVWAPCQYTTGVTVSHWSFPATRYIRLRHVAHECRGWRLWYLWAGDDWLSVEGGETQWVLSARLLHRDTCYVKRLHPSGPSHTLCSGRQKRHSFRFVTSGGGLVWVSLLWRRGFCSPYSWALLWAGQSSWQTGGQDGRWRRCPDSVLEQCCPLLAPRWTHSAHCSSVFLSRTQRMYYN